MGVTSGQPSPEQSPLGRPSTGLILPGNGASIQPSADQDAYLKSVTDELQDKGFIVAKLDGLLDCGQRQATAVICFVCVLRTDFMRID